jgi:hypothetical protein
MLDPGYAAGKAGVQAKQEGGNPIGSGGRHRALHRGYDGWPVGLWISLRFIQPTDQGPISKTNVSDINYHV